MKKLTNKEKEIMTLYWQHGPMFVRELQEHYDEPRPHFNGVREGVWTLVNRGCHQELLQRLLPQCRLRVCQRRKD